LLTALIQRFGFIRAANDEDYADQAVEWLQDLKTQSSEIRVLIANTANEHRNGVAVDEARTMLNDLGRDGAWGVHNYELTIELLHELKTKLEQPDSRP